MHILSVEGVSKDYGLRPILENVSLGLDSQDRVGVVGVNGSGKTTFLRLISGDERPDAGRITFAEGVTVGYLPQNPPYDPEATVLEAVDAETISWLEDYLNGYGGALLLVTHDRYFLDRVTTRILEVEKGAVQAFDGNYAYYLEKKEEQESARAVEGQKREMLIRRELAWLRRGAKARTRKSKSRVEAAKSLIAQPREAARAALDMSVGASRLGKKVLELRDIGKSYDGRVLVGGFSRTLKPGE